MQMNESCLSCEAALACVLGLCEYYVQDHYAQDSHTIVIVTLARVRGASLPGFRVSKDCPGLLKEIAKTERAWHLRASRGEP